VRANETRGHCYNDERNRVRRNHRTVSLDLKEEAAQDSCWNRKTCDDHQRPCHWAPLYFFTVLLFFCFVLQ
jgi:hypothetical protein